jgi:ABC-2 type transport system ATP-binding protein
MAAPSQTSVLVQAAGLGKDFGATTAVQGLDFELRKGEVVGLLGPNGAGKTTTIKLLLGLLKPSRGQVQVLGKDSVREARAVKQSLGHVSDEPSFYDFLTGKETLEFVARLRGLDWESTWNRLTPLIERFEVAAELAALVKTYSHGTKKKLALLAALAHQPSLLLLDEPTNGLDPAIAAAARDVLRQFAADGGAVLVSTHLLEMADRLCDRLLLIHRGRLVAIGTPSEVRHQAGVSDDASLEAAFLRLTERA